MFLLFWHVSIHSIHCQVLDQTNESAITESAALMIHSALKPFVMEDTCHNSPKKRDPDWTGTGTRTGACWIAWIVCELLNLDSKSISGFMKLGTLWDYGTQYIGIWLWGLCEEAAGRVSHGERNETATERGCWEVPCPSSFRTACCISKLNTAGKQNFPIYFPKQ